MSLSLLLDSGAFSCWKRREVLDIDRYIEFIQHYSDSIVAAVNLDVIPAEWGRVPTPDEVESSAEESFLNALYMREQGIECVPVFHQGERMAWLQEMIREGFEWIGISPANDRTTAQKIEWLDQVFAYLGGEHGYPTVWTHGFGVTALEILFRYPWYSVDSTTWLMVPSYGGIMIPQMKRNGEPDFEKAPFIVQCAERREGKAPPKSALNSFGHIDSLGAQQKDWVEAYLDSIEHTLSKQREHFMHRCRVCAHFYNRMMEAHTLPRFTREDILKKSLFFDDSFSGLQVLPSSPTPLWPRLKVFFTVPESWQHSLALTEEGCDDRLISYYYFKNQPAEKAGLDYYAENGVYRRVKRGKHNNPSK